MNSTAHNGIKVFKFANEPKNKIRNHFSKREPKKDHKDLIDQIKCIDRKKLFFGQTSTN